ncbi:Pls/PosA family non-ribosomal peptide synthetase [Streptomyces sp. NPDC007861]|uniref:Pls/PosA family non-ribosomal peptide synthetase n=1 Tax=Streptomyces sp. NPDC007861 TaxID=3154893 RepID=UPI0033E710E2
MTGNTVQVPQDRVEQDFAEVLADVVSAEQVPVDSHFFHDLGADSLVMARFCARIRKRAVLPPVSMKDVYRNPTVRSLATALTPALTSAAGPGPGPAADVSLSVSVPAVPGPAPAAASASAPVSPAGSVPAPASATDPVAETGRAGARQGAYVICGFLQLLLFLGYSCLAALAAVEGGAWVADASGAAGAYARSVAMAAVGLAGLCAFPVAAKWILIGRFTERQFPVWSLAYVRFWCVRTLIRTSPVRLFIGSPLYTLYLRALGARIGRNVAVFSTHAPVCADLLTIGDGTVIRRNVFLACYRAESGRIRTGRVTLGRDVHVGDQCVLETGTSMGDGARLGHASALFAGQSVPAGAYWHGSPAQPAPVPPPALPALAPAATAAATATGTSPGTDASPGTGTGAGPYSDPAAAAGDRRRWAYPLLQLLAQVGIVLPVAFFTAEIVLTRVPPLNVLTGHRPGAFTGVAFYAEALAGSFVLFFGAVLAGLAVTMIVPRLLNRLIEPDKVYPLYGVHYAVHRGVAALTNRMFLTTLFGDSSAIVHYLRRLGYDLCRIEQTGSNFGIEVKQDSPYLSRIGTGTMVADGLSLINAEYSGTSFRLSRVAVGAHSFLGNNIAYPSGGRTGDNCLLATKVQVPLDGPVREGVGLLGSPCFEIPRTVTRDNVLREPAGGLDPARLLAAKNRHNTLTAALYLLVRWLHFFLITLIAAGATALHAVVGAPVIAVAGALVLACTVVHYALFERAVTRFRSLAPLNCSIYEDAFWRHERFWKLASIGYEQIFDGTPYKNLVWRLLGVRLGKRVFDDGCSIVERTLTAIGDECTLNAGSVIQCHSQEDGAFKSDRSTLAARCTLGVGAFVHYGVSIGEGAQLACDSFLMKGEEIPEGARWGGNPARPVPLQAGQ